VKSTRYVKLPNYFEAPRDSFEARLHCHLERREERLDLAARGYL